MVPGLNNSMMLLITFIIETWGEADDFHFGQFIIEALTEYPSWLE